MNGPLASLKILDFSTLLPGPFASLLLADMGAQVLRVESPTRMDLVRVLPPHVDGTSASHAYLNRNKRCIALDLKQAEAVEVVKQLVQEYDIVLEQFRPGVMDHNQKKLTPEVAAEAKLFTTELLCKVVDEGVQLHGGWGYMWEYPICKMYANARIQRIFAGTSEIMKEIISRGMKL